MAAATNTLAQSGTNSPYSQLGLGQLSEQASGFNRGMNGLAYGFHEHNQINHINPASYSQLDSLTFIFDMGMSGQKTNFKEGGRKINANNADFEYAVAGFRAFKHLGVSFGILPYTNVATTIPLVRILMLQVVCLRSIHIVVRAVCILFILAQDGNR